MVWLLIGIGCDHKLESWSLVVMDSSHVVKPLGKLLETLISLLNGNGRYGCK